MNLEKDKSQYLRPIQVANRYGVSRSTIYLWMKSPDFPKPFKFGQGTFFAIADLVGWESSRKIKIK